MWKKIILVSVYVFYAIVLTLVLLVVRFPKDSFLSYSASLIEQELPGVDCAISDVAYLYPRSIRFDLVSLTMPSGPMNIEINSAVITLVPWTLLDSFHVGVDLYDGMATSDVIVHRDIGMIELPTLEASDINLEKIESLQKQLARDVTGRLSFSGRFGWRRNDLRNVTFSGNALLRDFRLPLKRPILQSDVLIFDEVSAVSSLNEGNVVFADGLGTGASYNTRFAGEIRSVVQWQQSELDLSGELVPQQEYLAKNRQVGRAVALLLRKYKSSVIPFRIRGSVRDPVFQFGTGQSL